MKTIVRLIMLVLMLAGWGVAAASLHIVRTPSTVTIVPKNRLAITDTYVDTREWTLAEVANHTSLVQRLIAAEKSDALSHLTDPDSSTSIELQLMRAIHDSPAPSKPSKADPTTAKSAGAQSDRVGAAIDSARDVAQVLKGLDVAWGK